MPDLYSLEILSHINTEIVPIIKAGAQASLAAYEQGFDPDENRNFFSNYSLGCLPWDNIYNRISYYKANFAHFYVKEYNKVLEIIPKDNPTPFYISRVGEDIRIPKTGRSIKRLAQEQLFLLDVLQESARQNGVFYLGYDLDGFRGLGDITLEVLTHVRGRSFQAETLHTFRAVLSSTVLTRPEPEKIIPPRLVRKQATELAKSVKKGKDNTALIAVGRNAPK